MGYIYYESTNLKLAGKEEGPIRRYTRKESQVRHEQNAGIGAERHVSAEHEDAEQGPYHELAGLYVD